jgi:DNA-directed RNA polymerase subunit RPC12/RpoP
MVKITCNNKPKALNGKVCGNTWNTNSTKLYVSCSSCGYKVLNPIHNTKRKEVKQ